MTDSASSRDRFIDVPVDTFRSMVGHRIVRVSYKTSGNLHHGADQRDRVVAHEVDHAVLVSTESVTLVLEWCIRSYDEFLNVLDSPDQGAAAAVNDVVDVTGVPQWSALVGSVIAGFGMATQQSEAGHELPWAVRIDVEHGASVVVGLGELRGAIPSYQPDNLVVIFEPEMARSYRVLDSSQSAWGRDLEL
jgi:hypothetical protein